MSTIFSYSTSIIIGIVISINSPSTLNLAFHLFFLSIILFSIIILTHILNFKKGYKYKLIEYILIHLWLFSYGYIIHDQQKEFQENKSSQLHIDKPNKIKGIITNISKTKDYNILEVRIFQEKTRLYLKKTVDIKFNYGDSISGFVYPKNISATDQYKVYLKNRNIYTISFCNPKQIRIYKNPNPSIKQLALRTNKKLGNRIDKIISTNIKHEEDIKLTTSILKALLIGDKSEIDKEVKKDFQLSGIIHLLALSGLHIGIIYLLITQLIFFIPYNHRGKILRAFIILVCIWIFTFISGLSTSTIRAATFISIHQFSFLNFRSPKGGDIIGISLIIMLSNNPNLLVDIGFQLSFAAVCSITFLCPQLFSVSKELIKLRSLQKITEMMIISISCQLSAGSIALYHFRIFPKYFLISNLIAIPLTTICIYIGVIILILGDIPLLGEILAHTICFIIKILHLVSSHLS